MYTAIAVIINFLLSLDIRAELGGRTGRDQYQDCATRRHFITRQDLRNITRKIRDFAHHRHSEDATSVDRIANELLREVPSPVLFYKPQNSRNAEYPCLQEESFLFVLMTEFQAQLFEEFGNKLVCIDSTHKTNEYKFKLITLLVVDEYHKG